MVIFEASNFYGPTLSLAKWLNVLPTFFGVTHLDFFLFLGVLLALYLPLFLPLFYRLLLPP
jgi:hypothetical protein